MKHRLPLMREKVAVTIVFQQSSPRSEGEEGKGKDVAKSFRRCSRDRGRFTGREGSSVGEGGGRQRREGGIRQLQPKIKKKKKTS